jgi:hypothetical protein
MKLLSSAFALTVLALAGCGNKPPSCSDDKTLALVKQIYFESFQELRSEPRRPFIVRELNFSSVNEAALSVSGIRTTSSDDKLGKLMCEGTLEIKLHPEVMAHLNSLLDRELLIPRWSKDGIKKTTTSFTRSITYSTQLTDDKNQQIVESHGQQDLAEIVIALGVMGSFNSLSGRAPINVPEAAPPPSKDTKEADKYKGETQ